MSFDGQAVGQKVFLLSPAHCGGKRAALLFNERANFELVRQLRKGKGARLEDIFSFVSGLYFRGKLAYAREFVGASGTVNRVWVITPDRGLVNPQKRINVDDLRSLAAVPIDADDPRYCQPLRRDLQRLERKLHSEASLVFLGSIATAKYLDLLLEIFDRRVLVPTEFIGRGDMSRGGLLLRCVRERRELLYVSAADARRQ
jgi:hypothetical protein